MAPLPYENEENIVFKDGVGERGLMFKLHGNNHSNHGNHHSNQGNHGNHHFNHQL